jgi:hypothetical protein
METKTTTITSGTMTIWHTRIYRIDELTSGFETIVSAHTNESMVADQQDSTVHGDEIFNPAATNKHSARPSADMTAAMDLPDGTVSSQNLTSSNYSLVWTPRINAFATASCTLLGGLLRMMNWWSSLMSILGIFALLYWAIAMFICDCIVVAVAMAYEMIGRAR